MTSVVMTGVGRDRVGIVADLTQLLYELGCNLLDSSMTLLRGEFALILMCEVPEQVSLNELQRQLDALEKQLGMRIHVRSMTAAELAEAPEQQNAFIVSVYGADRPGIVARVTRALADEHINVTDVQTKSTGCENKVFLMILEVAAPENVTLPGLETSLRRTAQQLEVDISVRALEAAEL
jgi:glycine cleavage system transcriptional repressor